MAERAENVALPPQVVSEGVSGVPISVPREGDGEARVTNESVMLVRSKPRNLLPCARHCKCKRAWQTPQYVSWRNRLLNTGTGALVGDKGV